MTTTADFDYALPPERIAQVPLVRRDDARLYVFDRGGGRAHRQVRDLPDLLPEGALLVVNDTRVIPARLHARKPTGGRVELLLVEPIAEPEGATPGRVRWRAMGRSGKAIRPGPLTLEGDDSPACEVLSVDREYVEVELGTDPAGLSAFLARAGDVPLPPYIRRERSDPSTPSGVDDRERYQTLFAAVPGAVAAPTAGLHFTPELLARLSARGIAHATLTLHVGPGTFASLREGALDAVKLHPERYVVPPATCDAIARARASSRPIVAVGTTVVRTLETAADDTGRVHPGRGSTRLFVRPGHRFRAVDMLLTNFHLPRSTLLMLVCAFAGPGAGADGGHPILDAYREAVREGYRFYSYGDAMLIR